MRTVTVDELIALNDEIRALVRAGIPLEPGLRSLGSDLPGRLGALARSLGDGLERGKSLVEVVDDSPYHFPRVYCAVVAAGARSGRLAAALEGLSATARQAAELRRVIIVSMIYPLFLVIVAGNMLSFTALKTAPVLARLYQTLEFEMPWWYERLNRLFIVVPSGMFLWIALVIAVIAALWLSRPSNVLPVHAMGIPTIGRLRHDGRMATFANVLALLIENEIPLQEAVRLAAEASGDKRLRRAAAVVADRIRSGVTHEMTAPAGFPPLLAWQITNGPRGEQLARSLRQTSENYRRRVLRTGQWLTAYFPIIMAGLVGGTVTLVYCLIVIAPFYHLLRLLGLP